MLFATALTNESIADALAMPRHRPLYIALAREILAVAEARGVTPESFDGFDPAAYLPNAPSVAAERSLVRRRPTEVDAQLGIVVTLGAEAGIPTPLTARLVALIHDVERGARAQSLETLDILAAVLA